MKYTVKPKIVGPPMAYVMIFCVEEAWDTSAFLQVFPHGSCVMFKAREYIYQN